MGNPPGSLVVRVWSKLTSVVYPSTLWIGGGVCGGYIRTAVMQE